MTEEGAASQEASNGLPRKLRGSRTLRVRAVAVALALTLVVGTVFGVRVATAGDTVPATAVAAQTSVQEPPTPPDMPGGTGLDGKVTSVSGSTITVDNNGSNVAVSTDTQTRFTRTVSGARADLKVGDEVMLDVSTEDGVLTADRVVDRGAKRDPGAGAAGGPGGDGGPPPGGGHEPPPALGDDESQERLMGSITSIDGEQLVIATKDGTQEAVTLVSDAQVLTTTETLLSDVEPGDTVLIGKRAGVEGAAIANEVRIGDGSVPGSGSVLGP